MQNNENLHMNEKITKEYKEKIVDIVNSVENEKVLVFLYDLLESFKKKWGII